MEIKQDTRQKMVAFWEKIKQNKVALGVVCGIVILVIGLGILLGKDSSIPKDAENQIANALNGSNSTNNSDAESVNAEIPAIDPYGIDNSGEYPIFSKVRYPILATGDVFDYNGKKTACKDEIVWISKNVTPSGYIVAPTLREMFNGEESIVFEPGNFVAKQSGLKFADAKIVDGIAKVYLTGEFDFGIECNANRLFTQVEEAVFQFGNVEGAQIYLNNELLR